MVATPWVDCFGNLLVDASGNPVYCEDDPCPGGDPECTPEDVGCVRVCDEDWDGSEMSPLTVVLAGGSAAGSFCGTTCAAFCEARHGSWVLPYDPSLIPSFDGAATLHGWSETFTEIDYGDPSNKMSMTLQAVVQTSQCRPVVYVSYFTTRGGVFANVPVGERMSGGVRVRRGGAGTMIDLRSPVALPETVAYSGAVSDPCILRGLLDSTMFIA